MRLSLVLRALPLAAACALPACGGGNNPADFAPPPGSLLSVTAALPQAHEGALALDAATASNEHRAADPFSAEPYCLLRFVGARHPNGTRYDLALAFRTADRRVLAFTITRQRGDDPWWVGAFDPPAAEAGVDLPTRTVELRRLRSTQGAMVDMRATFEGTLRFPANPAQPACG